MNISEKISLMLFDKGFNLSPNSRTEKIINDASKLEKTSEEVLIAKQHGIANKLFILMNGEAEFTKDQNNELYKLATLKGVGMPLGISGLNPPSRYMADIYVKGNSEYIEIDLKKLNEIENTDPEYASFFYSYLVFQSMSLIWSSRNLKDCHLQEDIKLSEGVKTGGEIVNTQRIKDTAFLAFLNEQDLMKLLDYSSIKLFSANEYITTEGRISDGINILLKGKVDATFNIQKQNVIEKNTRTIARSGVALSLSAGLHSIKSPYSIKATRDTTVIKFSNDFIDNLIQKDPDLALKFLKRQLWQLGKYIQTSTGLSTYPAKDEAELFNYLLNDNSSRIPVNSKLYNIPYLLKNHLTHSLAFDIIYEVVVSGNENEKSIASLMIDAMSGLERKNRFFNQLTKIYNRVATSHEEINKKTLQKLTNSDFIKAFDQVPYVIKGMENLPEEPTNIFFYNHLASIQENTLANGHSFSIDSHFISAKILFPKYGDGGQRIARYSRNTEFWRYNYYENLDYIFVHTPESDKLEESDVEKKKRKKKLFVETQDIFNQNRPLVIAPEGTSETEDNITENSPGPFKPGAFLLAGQLEQEPLLIPIALANFDHSISNTIYSAVIKEPIKINDYVKDIKNKKELEKFLIDYRIKFRSYVEEAIELANNIYNDSKELNNVETNINLVSPIEEEYEADVRELEINLHNKELINKKIVLYGSSTFKDWTNAHLDLSFNNLSNLGFGGSTLVSCRTYFNRIVVPFSPDTMLFYAGDNDIGSGTSAEELLNEFMLFTSEVNEKMPHTRCFFISIKPSIFRKNYLDTILDANDKIKNAIQHLSQWKYIDLCSPMLETGYEKFYGEDPLHMNVLGYSLLSKLIRDELSIFNN
ncbi:1-acyl-sn-glycerol-3-phosphate acyltransferase [Pelagibacteraceae bacterium]|nr:1-acyl-sn-glycerol-3-phosphate acyltransferase [Pelagibacteraceae bacterium]